MNTREEIYFSTTDVRVTSQQVVIGGQVFPLDQVDGARVALLRPRKYMVALYSYLGLVLLYILENWAPDALRDIFFYGKWAFLAASAVLLILSLREIRYKLRITGTFGQAEPFVSKNRTYVQKAVNAINGAVSKRKEQKTASGLGAV